MRFGLDGPVMSRNQIGGAGRLAGGHPEAGEPGRRRLRRRLAGFAAVELGRRAPLGEAGMADISGEVDCETICRLRRAEYEPGDSCCPGRDVGGLRGCVRFTDETPIDSTRARLQGCTGPSSGAPARRDGSPT